MNVRYKYAEHAMPWARWSQCSGWVLKDDRNPKGSWIAEISVWWSQMFPAKLERRDLQSEPCRLTSQQEPFWQHLQIPAGGKRSKHVSHVLTSFVFLVHWLNLWNIPSFKLSASFTFQKLWIVIANVAISYLWCHYGLLKLSHSSSCFQPVQFCEEV